MSEKNEGTMTASEQIDLLASFIMREVDGEPSRSEGAIPCAIRIIQRLEEENAELRKELNAITNGFWTQRELDAAKWNARELYNLRTKEDK